MVRVLNEWQISIELQQRDIILKGARVAFAFE